MNSLTDNMRHTTEGEGPAHAFTLAAPHYDADQARNRVARWSRSRSLSLLTRFFRPGDYLLEIGCGTGEEALHMARMGARIVATDAAPGMIASLQAKLKAEPPALQNKITPLVLPASKLDQLSPRYGELPFDGAYSSFGPLNCEPHLAPISAALSQLIKPGGYVLLSFINRYCAWETLWHLFHAKGRSAFRRWSGLTHATVRSQWQATRIVVYYPSARELEQIFSPHFDIIAKIALPWLLPPQYLDSLFHKKKALFNLIAHADHKLAARWPFNLLGDHLVLVLKRKDAERWQPKPLSPWRRALRALAIRALKLRYRGFAPGNQPPHWARVNRLRLWVERTVFDPSVHFTSAYLSRFLCRYLDPATNPQPPATILDLGTGAGLLAIATAQAGAKGVTGVDINPAAVMSARRNARGLGLHTRIRILQSDFFSALADQRFDVIVTNPPYYPVYPKTTSELAYYAGSQLEWFSRLAAEASEHLAPNGSLLIVLSDTAPINPILAIFAKHGWTARLISRKDMITESMAIFELKPTTHTPPSPQL